MQKLTFKTKEERSIFLLARPQYSENIYQELDTNTQSDFNWTFFLRRLESYRYSGWCYYQLQQYGLDTRLPSAVRDRLEQTMTFNAYHNRKIQEVALQTTQLLTAENIDVLWLKGVASNELLYPDLSVRPLTDADLLIRQEDRQKVKSVLVANGFICVDPSPELWDTRAYQLLCYHHQYTYYSPSFYNRSIILEVHWRPGVPTLFPGLPVDAFWDEVSPFSNNSFMLTLSPENNVIYSCIHLYKHLWSHLLTALDLNLLLNIYEIDWRLIEERVSKWQLSSIITASLLFVNQLFGTEIPSVYYQADKYRFPQLIRFMQQQHIDQRCQWMYQFNSHPFHLLFLERWEDKLTCLSAVLFFPSQTDYRLFPVKDRWYFLYFFIKPFRLLFSFVFRMMSASK